MKDELRNFSRNCTPRKMEELVRLGRENFLMDETLRNFKGSFAPPLIDFLDMEHIVPDVLHMFLRIFDAMFELTLAEVTDKELFEKGMEDIGVFWYLK